MATASIVYFVIHARRNFSALKRVAGQSLSGILCSDRWCVYDDWPGLRQLCWAHVKRNWEKRIAAGGAAKRVGEAWLDGQRRVFELWHLFRGGGCTRQELDERMGPLYIKLWQVLNRGLRTRDRTFVRFCRRLADRYDHLWTFVTREGVEPTNNHAERVQRRAVLWRRRSFGCHSADGLSIRGTHPDGRAEPALAEAIRVGIPERNPRGPSVGKAGPAVIDGMNGYPSHNVVGIRPARSP